MANYTYGSVEIDTELLDDKVREWLMGRTLSHILGNECAAKVTAWKEAEGDKGNEPNDAEIAAALHDFRQAAVDKLLAGTIGRAAAGPRADAFERLCNAIAIEKLTAAFKAKGGKMPVKDQTVTVKGVGTMDRAQLVKWRAAMADVQEIARKRQAELNESVDDVALLIG